MRALVIVLAVQHGCAQFFRGNRRVRGHVRAARILKTLALGLHLLQQLFRTAAFADGHVVPGEVDGPGKALLGCGCTVTHERLAHLQRFRLAAETPQLAPQIGDIRRRLVGGLGQRDEPPQRLDPRRGLAQRERRALAALVVVDLLRAGRVRRELFREDPAGLLLAQARAAVLDLVGRLLLRAGRRGKGYRETRDDDDHGKKAIHRYPPGTG